MDTPIYNALTDRLSPETFARLCSLMLGQKLAEAKYFRAVTR